MDEILQQIKLLTRELRPIYNGETFYWFDPATLNVRVDNKPYPEYDRQSRDKWNEFNFASTNKAEVEEYADCYKRLKLYQLLGKKAEVEFPLKMFYAEESDRKKYDSGLCFAELYYGTDFGYVGSGTKGQKRHGVRACVLGGVWFSREEDRLEALKICGITKEMQEKMSKYGLGGA